MRSNITVTPSILFQPQDPKLRCSATAQSCLERCCRRRRRAPNARGVSDGRHLRNGSCAHLRQADRAASSNRVYLLPTPSTSQRPPQTKPQRRYDVGKDSHVERASERVRGVPPCPKSREITLASPKGRGAADQDR